MISPFYPISLQLVLPTVFAHSPMLWGHVRQPSHDTSATQPLDSVSSSSMVVAMAMAITLRLRNHALHNAYVSVLFILQAAVAKCVCIVLWHAHTRPHMPTHTYTHPHTHTRPLTHTCPHTQWLKSMNPLQWLFLLVRQWPLTLIWLKSQLLQYQYNLTS